MIYDGFMELTFEMNLQSTDLRISAMLTKNPPKKNSFLGWHIAELAIETMEAVTEKEKITELTRNDLDMIYVRTMILAERELVRREFDLGGAG